jgi:hypothetical protein
MCPVESRQERKEKKRSEREERAEKAEGWRTTAIATLSLTQFALFV